MVAAKDAKSGDALIIDSHVHLIDPPFNEENVIFPLSDGTKINTGMIRATVTVDNLIRSMGDHNIDKAMVMATNICSNEFLSGVVKAHSDRLVGFAWVTNPKDADESIRQFDKAVNRLGLRGLKLHPIFQGFCPADPEIIPLIQHAAELGVPVLIHSFPGHIGRGYFSYDLPEHIDILKKNAPEAIIIIAHMGGSRFLDLITVGQKRGVYVETSQGLTTIASVFGVDFSARFIRRVGVDNFLFGSDWLGPHEEMEPQLDLIEKMDLTREEKEKILGENIRKILRDEL